MLRKLVDDINTGNSNITEEDATSIIKYLKLYTDKTEKLSKYQACQYLNVARSTFDKYVSEGKIPKGKKEAGFKELFWLKKDLDKITSM